LKSVLKDSKNGPPKCRPQTADLENRDHGSKDLENADLENTDLENVACVLIEKLRSFILNGKIKILKSPNL